MTENSMQVVCEMINTKLKELSFQTQELTTETLLTEIGIDSLSMVELIFNFAEKYKVDIELLLEGQDPPRTVGDLNNIVTSFINGA